MLALPILLYIKQYATDAIMITEKVQYVYQFMIDCFQEV